ncbi:uncharacterized protein AAG666_023026 isoform 2-T2 [Megaptera novaeangliae]
MENPPLPGRRQAGWSNCQHLVPAESDRRRTASAHAGAVSGGEPTAARPAPVEARSSGPVVQGPASPEEAAPESSWVPSFCEKERVLQEREWGTRGWPCPRSQYEYSHHGQLQATNLKSQNVQLGRDVHNQLSRAWITTQDGCQH